MKGVPKGHLMVSLGLAAVTGAGFGLAFTVLDDASIGPAVSVLVIVLGGSPLLAGWLSPELKHVLLFPISVMGGISVAWAIGGPLGLDTPFVGYVIMMGVIYGGGASLAYSIGWIARQYLGRLRGRGMIVSHLAVASLVAACCSVALSALFIATPFVVGYWSAILAPIGMIGVVAGAVIVWSDRHSGRWCFLGLGLSLLYLGASVAPTVYAATAHLYGPVALILVTLAIWNVFKWKRHVAH